MPPGPQSTTRASIPSEDRFDRGTTHAYASPRMRITFELEPADIERFHEALARARRSAGCADEFEVIEAAKYALDHLCAGNAPAYVRKRVIEVQHLILML